MRMYADAAALLGGRKLRRPRVMEQQKRRQLRRASVVRIQAAHRNTIAHPVPIVLPASKGYFLHGFISFVVERSDARSRRKNILVIVNHPCTPYLGGVMPTFV